MTDELIILVQYSHGILGAAGDSSQTSKILNLPLGDMGVLFRLIVHNVSYIVYLEYPGFIPFYTFGLFFFGVLGQSPSSVKCLVTGEIGAIALLLITIPPQYLATFFKKASQMTGDDSPGCDYQPRLLNPFYLSSLLISHSRTPHL